MENSSLIIDGKYFDLTVDNRFPLEIPVNGWQTFTQKIFTRPKGNFIYLIRCNEHLYVGGDCNSGRIYCHKNSLIKNCHINNVMRRTFNKYGIESFFYLPLIEIPKEFIDFRDFIENEYIRRFNTFIKKNINGFNLIEFATAHLLVGESNPFFGKKHSEETRKKMQKRQYTQEQIDKIRESSPLIKTYELTNPFGEKVLITNLKHFCRTNNLKISGMRSVVAGRIKSHRGWTKNGLEKKEKQYKNVVYIFLSPEKQLFHVKSITKFAKGLNLSYGGFYRLMKNQKQDYHGWLFVEIIEK